MPSTADITTLIDEISIAAMEDDPFPTYARLRAEAPVAYVPAVGAWMVSTFDDVKRVHQDPATFRTRFMPETLSAFGDHNILNIDGERHQRYRKALHRSLAPKVVDGYAESAIGSVVDQRLALLEGRTSVDLVAEYFEPISVLALGGVMGVRDIEADTLRRWFRGIILGSTNTTGDPEMAAEANAISAEIDDTLWDAFARLDAAPDDSILSHLLQCAEGATLEERVLDVTPSLKVVVGGGLQEPGHGASSLAFALLENPEAASTLARDPEGMSAQAIEEGVRWMSPIQIDTRLTSTEVELGGQTIPADSWIFASLASANRDERKFGADADRFILDRPKERNLAFGFGSHFCSGNYFGRTMMRLSVNRLWERFPDVHLDPAVPSSFTGFMFRAPADVNVQMG